MIPVAFTTRLTIDADYYSLVKALIIRALFCYECDDALQYIISAITSERMRIPTYQARHFDAKQ